jgi:glutamyl-tRNA synthetase
VLALMACRSRVQHSAARSPGGGTVDREARAAEPTGPQKSRDPSSATATTGTGPAQLESGVMSENTAHPFTTATGTDVRVRFCPSPTGTPHVGLIRTALFNWAYARHTGGKFIFRIEDTDAARDSEESYGQIIEALRWLHLDWDEGISVGGPHAPYRQSERYDIYRDVVEQLKVSGHIYESFATGEEIEARNVSLGRDPKMGYDNFERNLTDEQKAAYRAEGRTPALRLKVPDEDLSFDDLVRGEITFPAGSFSDFVVVRPNGHPLYPFVNPVDDALMGVTHVLRGEDLLSSTPRQIALYHALIDIGLTTFVPRFGHLPYVMGDGNKKLSKRDPESNLFHHRDRGFIPEGLVNYLALLGWSLTHDHIRLLDVDDFAQRTIPYLGADGVVGEPLTEIEQAILKAAAPLVQERIALLGEAPAMLGFLFVAGDVLVHEADALASLPQNTAEILAASAAALQEIAEADWTHDRVHTSLTETLIDGLTLKPRAAFGPLRVAISGRRVSPPLFESMEILGKAESLARLSRLSGTLPA